MNENSLIKDIGRSYIVSSFIPAALFLVVDSLVFKDFAPYFLIRRIIDNDLYYAGQWIILVLMAAWLSFALYSGWNTTVRLFEGYYFPKSIQKNMIARLEKIYYEKSRVLNEYKSFLHKKELTTEDEKRMDEIEPITFRLQQELEMNFPIHGDLLPTRLGNILRASERYPFDRYQIEAITIFPRLVHLLPAEFANQLEESNNKFIFLLNSSLLAIVTGVGAVAVSFLRVPCYLFNENLMRDGLFSFYGQAICPFSSSPVNFFQFGFRNLNEWKYFALGLIFLLFGYVLYRVATVMARAYANLLRASYDLYRYELLKNLWLFRF